jgi:hypothetical protein
LHILSSHLKIPYLQPPVLYFTFFEFLFAFAFYLLWFKILHLLLALYTKSLMRMHEAFF